MAPHPDAELAAGGLAPRVVRSREFRIKGMVGNERVVKMHLPDLPMRETRMRFRQFRELGGGQELKLWIAGHHLLPQGSGSNTFPR